MGLLGHSDIQPKEREFQKCTFSNICADRKFKKLLGISFNARLSPGWKLNRRAFLLKPLISFGENKIFFHPEGDSQKCRIFGAKTREIKLEFCQRLYWERPQISFFLVVV